jgi:uncharacterized delta-60 repeat protein
MVQSPTFLSYQIFPTSPLSFLSLPQGSLIVGGQESGFFSPQPAPGALFAFTTRLLLNKYKSNGTLDSTFGNNGIVALPGFGGITKLTLQGDNKIVGLWNDSVIRFNPNGSLDGSFGNNGVAKVGFNAVTVLLQPNGNLLVAGTLNGDFALKRLNTNGTIDPTFGNNGLTVTDFGDEEFVRELAIVGDTLFAYGKKGNPNTFGSSEPAGRLAAYTLNTPCTPPAFLNTLPIVGNATCGNNDGQISIIPTSGTFPYMYSFDGGATYAAGPNAGVTRFNLTAGTYQLRLKDANGCESVAVTRQVNVQNCPPTTCTPPTFLNTLSIVGNATCGNNDGQISIIPTSGTAPFMYSFDGGATYTAGPNTGVTRFNLATGTYQLRLKDVNGCESEVITKTIIATGCPTCTPPTFLNTRPIVGDATCNKSDGQISIIPTSGTGPFMYSINGGNTYVSGPNAGYTFFNLPAGMYQLRLKAGNGCETDIVTREVKMINCPSPTPTFAGVNKGFAFDENTADAKLQIAAYPNPSKGLFRVRIQQDRVAKAEVFIIDAKGIVVQRLQLNVASGNVADINLKGKAAGMYTIKVVSTNGVKTTKILVQ